MYYLAHVLPSQEMLLEVLLGVKEGTWGYEGCSPMHWNVSRNYIEVHVKYF